MVGAKKFMSRRPLAILNIEEDRRLLAELTMAYRVEVQNLVAQATERVLQLRARNIIVSTSEPQGSRRKKAARNKGAKEEDADPTCVEEQQKDGEQGGLSAPRSLEESQDEASRRAAEGDQQEAKKAVVDTKPVRAGHKRGRRVAVSQSKSKRSKVQRAQTSPEEPTSAAVASCGGMDQPPLQGGTAEAGAASGVPADAASGKAPVHSEHAPVTEEAAARPLEDLPEKDYQPLSFRVQSSAMGNPVDESCTQAENRPSAPVPVPSPAGPRQTRSRRVQTAVDKQARLPPAATQRALRKNARQKRDVNEAELTSPGLHPKTKPTRSTVSGAALVALPMYKAARTKLAAILGKEMETPLVAEAASAYPHNANRAESGPSSASGSQSIANGSPRVLPTEQPPPPQQHFLGVTDRLRGTSPAWKLGQGLRTAPEHLGTGLSKRELVQVSELATAVIDKMRPEQSGAGPSAVGQAGGQQQLVLPESISNMDPPAAVQMDSEQTPTAPSANTMKMPVHSPVTSGKVVAADVRSQKTPVSPGLVYDRARPLGAKAHNSLAGVAPLLSNGLFSFGIKPKEHSSPSMPHFGVGTEQPAAKVLTRDAEEETDEAKADNATVSVCGAEDPDFNSDSGLSVNLDQATGGELLQEDWKANRSEEDDADALEPRAEVAIHLDARNRSLSLSLAMLSPIAMAPGAVAVIQQGASATSEPCVLRPSEPVEDGSVQLQHVEKEVDNGDVAGNWQIDDRPEDEADDGHPCEPGMDFCEASMQGEEATSKNVAAADMAANMAAECGTTAEPDSDNSEGEDREEQDHSNGHGRCVRTSINPGASEQATVQLVEAQAGPSTGGGVTSAPAPPNKPKGGNLVSCVRSFLPQRNAPTPPPAAGKKPVKVKALEAALAVKQKEAARQAERAHARAAVADRRQGQGDANHPSNANSRPDTAQVPPSVRLTPSKSAARTQGGDAAANCITTAGVGHPAQSGPTSTAAQEKRNDGATGAAAVPIAGSVRAKATFFQEQAKKATVAESGVGRRPAGGAGTGPQGGGFSNKAGPGARVALAIGQNEGSLAATFAAAAVAAAEAASAAAVVSAGPPASATKSNVAGLASSRAGNPAPVAGPAETIADKQKRVEAKRREDDERRRAELEARTKAKDDKLRGIETAKQQQRMAGGGGAPRPPPPLIPNPLAVQVPAKRLPLIAAGATAGQAGAVQVKPEPENSNKIGPPWLSAAKTPGPKIASAKTPGPKAVTAASNMVSPAVQLQVKLLPAVHAEGPKGAGGAPGLPKSRPGGTIQTKQAQVEAAMVALALSSQSATEQKTPAVVDLTDEERRNVQAIQTSPYVMQVKPRTPGMLTATKPVFNNYEISPYRSDSDASDDDGVESGRVRKPMPAWAAQDKVLQAVKAQAAINPDTIFGHYPSTIDLVKVFAGMPPASLTVNGGRPRRDYRPRGSSGIWSDDI